MKKQNGITLVSLVITIIVMLILAGVALSSLTGDNSVLGQAQTATMAYRFAGYKEQLDMILNKDMTCAGESLRKYIPQIDDDELDEFIIINGQLAYVGDEQLEKEIATQVGIDVIFAANTTADDVINITEKLFPAIENDLVPKNDNEPTPPSFIGKRLYDRTSINMERWNMVIEYDSNNNEVARYGSGYYLLEPGNYTINGEEYTFTGRYLLDYKKDTLIGISDRAVEWSIDTTLAVRDKLVLNIDPTNLADGKWDGITKYGDVLYNKQTKALVFNESESNPNGSGGYLQLSRNGVDFKDGFTFEIYANLSRLAYTNETLSDNKGLGLFCRMPTLSSTYTQALRFGYTKAKTICKFNSSSSWTGSGSVLSTTSSGSVASNSAGYNANEDFYLTVVYNRSDSTKDKVEYYINGELYGYTYYGKNSYDNGLATWNHDSCPFFVGVSPWHKNNNLYYLKGSVYTCRLYTKAMTSQEVKDNMDMTQKYRSSF